MFQNAVPIVFFSAVFLGQILYLLLASEVGSGAALQLGAPAPGVTPLPEAPPPADPVTLVRLLPLWRLNDLLKLVEPYCGGVRRTDAAL